MAIDLGKMEELCEKQRGLRLEDDVQLAFKLATAVPSLIDEIRRLRKQVRGLESAAANVRDAAGR